MKTARLHAVGDLRLHDEPDPRQAHGEEIIRVSAVGLCGSDRHWFEDGGIGDATLRRPLVLGHEVAGVIEGGPRDGERVVLDPADPCGRCDLCRSGRGHLCEELRFLGHGETDGGLRTLMAWPGSLLHRIPDAVGDAEAVLLEPLGIALHALDRAGVRSGERVGVFGCGPIGLLLVQLLRSIGSSVAVATDVVPHRVEAARAMGASAAVLAPDDGGAAMWLPPIDVAFEVAGEDSAVEAAIASLRPGGRLALVGIPATDRTTIPAAAARRRELTIALCRRMTGADLQQAIRVVGQGDVGLGSLVTESQPLEAVGVAFDGLSRRRGLKIVVRPGAVAR